MNTQRRSTPRSEAVQALLNTHVSGRLQRALSKWEGKTDALAKQETKKAIEKYQLASILEKGGNCAANIAVATHVAKATHPDLKAKWVSNPYVRFDTLAAHKEVGSHLLTIDGSLADTTGDGAHNAAAYELYLLLDIAFEGKSLGVWLEGKDPDVALAFSPATASDDEAKELAARYASLLKEKSKPATDTRAKQLYWLVGEDPSDNSAYHLLAPLYATSLAHAVYNVIQEDRFGEEGKLARQARREGKWHDGVVRDYPNLAVQKLGGTKPQNISQLNSERRGNNYLLSCAPPIWTTSKRRAPWRLSSVFDRIYGVREEVQITVRALFRFLKSDPPQNADTRNRVDVHVDSLIDELVQMASEYQHGLDAGWSHDARVELADAEQLWLDPRRAAIEEEIDFRERWLKQDWPAEIGRRFGNWLNVQLDGHLPVGDAEMRQWRKELLLDEDEGGWAQQLHRLRKAMDAPTYTPVREGAV